MCLAPLLASLVSATVTADSALASSFDFHTRDRVVLVGDALIERDARYGWLETRLTLDNAAKNLTFRNLGWSGDTVAGLSRAGFDPPEAGFRQLVDQIKAASPTVIVFGYGMADSFEGKAGLDHFIKGYERLLDAVAPTKARLVVLSPIAHEDHGPPLPDPAPHNRMLELYTQAVGSIARRRGAFYVDLFTPTRVKRPRWLTDNGIHFTEKGYQVMADLVAGALEGRPGSVAPFVEITQGGKATTSDHLQVRSLHVEPGRIRFTLIRGLPGEPPPRVAVAGLKPGRYRLAVEGRVVADGSAETWAGGILVEAGPDHDQIERLRTRIQRKNVLFFDRWRPQNITYLFGFRKHEQGNNAVEIPRFDPLIADAEREIQALSGLVPRVYELKLGDEEQSR